MIENSSKMLAGSKGLAGIKPTDDDGGKAMSIAASLVARCISSVAVLLLRTLSWSWRYNADEIDQLDENLASSQRVLLVFWHGKYVPLFMLLRDRGATVFTSRSFRGSVIAEMCHRFGHHCVLLPTDHASRSLLFIREALRHRRLGAVAIDGPLGPYHQVKRGILKVACELGYTIIPISVAARRKWISQNRWDQMQVPALFAKVEFVSGELIPLVPTNNKSESIALQEYVRVSLDIVDGRAEESARLN